MTPHGPERRTQALRRSGAAGIHDQRVTRSEAERAAVADQEIADVVVGPATPVVGELMAFAYANGCDTRGCDCGHDGLGPMSHLQPCPVPARAWREKAYELARRLDAITE